MEVGGCSVARLRRSCAHLNNAHNKVCNGEGGGEGGGRGLGRVPLVSRYENEEGDGVLPGAVTYLEEEAKQPNARTRMSAL